MVALHDLLNLLLQLALDGVQWSSSYNGGWVYNRTAVTMVDGCTIEQQLQWWMGVQ